eukprot:Clim_evm61s210 gene=Clim_evmTU61s210
MAQPQPQPQPQPPGATYGTGPQTTGGYAGQYGGSQPPGATFSNQPGAQPDPGQQQQQQQRRLSTAGQSLYAALGVEKTATEDEIKRAYRKKALKCHPDKNPSPQAHEEFAELNRVYHILADKRKREIYDESGSVGLQAYDQGGEDMYKIYKIAKSKRFRFCFVFCGIITLCYFCCCCCFCCCGRCGPKPEEMHDVPTAAEMEEEERRESRYYGDVPPGGFPQGPDHLHEEQPKKDGDGPIILGAPPPSTDDRPMSPPVANMDGAPQQPIILGPPPSAPGASSDANNSGGPIILGPPPGADESK